MNLPICFYFPEKTEIASGVRCLNGRELFLRGGETLSIQHECARFVSADDHG